MGAKVGRRLALCRGLAVLAVAAGALIGVVHGVGASDATGSTVRITEHDFGLKGRGLDVPAGVVTFVVQNRGPSTHEFNVDRTDLPADQLPLRDDGLTVNEDSALLQRAGSLSQIADGTTEQLTVRLRPGHYVIYCNLEGHYLGGMHLSLNVR